MPRSSAPEAVLTGVFLAERIRRIKVWGAWLRVAHASMAVATLLLLATGWLIGRAPSLAEAAVEIHYLAASLLVFSLALRAWLGLAGRASDRFETLWPRGPELAAARASLLFYLSLGRARRPNWFAHNPLWKPLYLLLFLLLLLAAVTGWLMPDTPLLGRLYLPHVHAFVADLVAAWMLAHLFCVVLQDVRGNSADVSAMLNGDRYFDVDREGLAGPELPQVAIRVDDIGRR
jgi:Ni/Fe-hydrogenase 1 B-type cytochrome subunit